MNNGPDLVPDLAAIREARNTIAASVQRTPLLRSVDLSTATGVDILLKLESLQPTGAFKLRGATNAVRRLSIEQRSRGVGCCSTGNHGRAVAYAAGQAGIRAVVCLSGLVPENKVAAIRALGAEVRRIGRSQDEGQREIDRLVRDEGLIDIPPFDHPDVIAGQGTIALELLEDRPDLSTIVAPLSGGGLISGIAIAAKALKADIRIVGVSMENGAAMHESLAAGRPIEVTEVASLADSLGGGIGLGNRHTFAICRTLVDETVLVSETEIYRAMQALFREQRLVTEGAGSVGVAALLAGKLRLEGPTALIVSGNNVDLDQFLAIASGQPIKVGTLMVKG
jgi:threonine dehydratase